MTSSAAVEGAVAFDSGVENIDCGIVNGYSGAEYTADVPISWWRNPQLLKYRIHCSFCNHNNNGSAFSSMHYFKKDAIIKMHEINFRSTPSVCFILYVMLKNQVIIILF